MISGGLDRYLSEKGVAQALHLSDALVMYSCRTTNQSSMTKRLVKSRSIRIAFVTLLAVSTIEVALGQEEQSKH
jgi:hypothetical protein